MDFRLQGIVTKMRRAREHIVTLDRDFHSWAESHPYQVVNKFEPDTKLIHFVVDTVPEMDPRFGAIVGDICHNLRSALDYLIWPLVIANGGKAGDEDTMFPIWPTLTSGGDFIRTNERRRLRGVAPEAIAAIERLQPYHRGNGAQFHPLAILHELSNADKHREIQVSMLWFKGAGVAPNFRGEDCFPLRHTFWLEGRGRLETGAKIGQVKVIQSGPDPYVDMNAGLPSDIGLSDGRPLVRMLKGIHLHLVHRVFPALDRFL